jgi:hypothetical protein
MRRLRGARGGRREDNVPSLEPTPHHSPEERQPVRDLRERVLSRNCRRDPTEGVLAEAHCRRTDRRSRLSAILERSGKGILCRDGPYTSAGEGLAVFRCPASAISMGFLRMRS